VIICTFFESCLVFDGLGLRLQSACFIGFLILFGQCHYNLFMKQTPVGTVGKKTGDHHCKSHPMVDRQYS